MRHKEPPPTTGALPPSICFFISFICIVFHHMVSLSPHGITICFAPERSRGGWLGLVSVQKGKIWMVFSAIWEA